MPSLAMYHLQCPTDEYEFETIVKEYGTCIYGGIASSLGVRGQKQNGVDIIITKDDGRIVGIQCKNYANTPISESLIGKWINEANTSPIKFSMFIIATSARKKAKIQEYVARQSNNRISFGDCPVTIVFWDDIELFIKQNPLILRLHYPMLNCAGTMQIIGNDSGCLKRIKTGFELKEAFFDEYVKYHIYDMIRVDPFTGFNIDLIADSDGFAFCVNNLINRAPSLIEDPAYIGIKNFLCRFNAFNGYLSTICQVAYNGNYVIFTNSYEKPDEYRSEVEKLRHGVMDSLSELQ